MTRPKYASAEERRAAASAQAKQQMLAQWERQRQEAGQEIGYFGCHRRVRTARGRAGDQDCVTCGKQARHWAHIHDTDPADPQNYQPMCQKCHWAYDQVSAKGKATMGPEGRRAMAVLAWSRRTPEQRRAIALKAWATKRRKKEQVNDPAAPPLAGP